MVEQGWKQTLKDHVGASVAELVPGWNPGGAAAELWKSREKMVVELQAVEGTLPEAIRGHPGFPPWSGSLLRDCAWRAGLMLEGFVRDFLPWEGPHVGVGKDYEEFFSLR